MSGSWQATGGKVLMHLQKKKATFFKLPKYSKSVYIKGSLSW